MTPAPHDLGCTHIGEWSTDDAGSSLEEQLRAAGIATERLETPHLAGNAYLLRYISPKTGEPMVVLCVPRLVAANADAESYYYFPASVFTEHPDEEWWIQAYEAMRAIDRSSQ